LKGRVQNGVPSGLMNELTANVIERSVVLWL